MKVNAGMVRINRQTLPDFMAKLMNARYVLAVPDLERSAAYYRDVLGFSVREVGDPGWRFFVRDNIIVMAGECPNAIPPTELGDHSYFGYIDVADIDEWFEEVESKGAELLKPLRDEPWGMREFGIRTIDGHRIMLGMSTDSRTDKS